MQIKTDSEVGSNDQIRIYAYDLALRNSAGDIDIVFSDPPKYKLDYCTTWVLFPADLLPAEKDKVWTITRSIATTGKRRIVINCNNKEVLDLAMSESACTETGWDYIWKRDAKKVWIMADTIHFYREGK